MRHINRSYHGVLKYPQKKGVWYREKNPQIGTSQPQPPVLISQNSIGKCTLVLRLFSTHTEPFDEWLKGKLPTIWGYEFFLYEGECIYVCGLHDNSYFETTDIDEAEKVAEDIWRCMNFPKSTKGIRT